MHLRPDRAEHMALVDPEATGSAADTGGSEWPSPSVGHSTETPGRARSPLTVVPALREALGNLSRKEHSCQRCGERPSMGRGQRGPPCPGRPEEPPQSQFGKWSQRGPGSSRKGSGQGRRRGSESLRSSHRRKGSTWSGSAKPKPLAAPPGALPPPHHRPPGDKLVPVPALPTVYTCRAHRLPGRWH